MGGSDQTDTGRIAALLSGCGPREALPVLHRVAGVRRGGLPALRFQGWLRVLAGRLFWTARTWRRWMSGLWFW